MNTYFLRRVIGVGLLFLLGIGSASAQAVSGNLQPPTPKMPVVFIVTPNCSSQGATPVTYRVHALSVAASGSYTISVSYPSGDVAFYVYQGSFDPNNGLANCIAATNSGSSPKSLTVPLTAGTPYFVVPFDDRLQQDSGAYTLAVSGPSAVGIDGPAPTAVPALGAPALVLMGLMLTGLAGWRLRRT